MTTTFDDRERGFEAKFAHDEEMQFRAQSRRTKLLGLWAAELLGKKGEEANAYALEVVKEDLSDPGHEGVVRKVAADLGDLADAETVRAQLAALLPVAKLQLMNEAN